MRYLTIVLCLLCSYSLNSFAQAHNPNFVDLPNGVVYATVVDANYVYLGGGFTQCGAISRQSLVRYDRFTGALDLTWNPAPGGLVYDIKVMNNNVYVSGLFSFIGGQFRSNIAKLSDTGTGTADPTWNPSVNSLVRAIEVSGNDVFIGGFFTSVGGQARNYVAKLSATGTGDVDPTWNPNADNSVVTLELQGNELFIGGFFTSVDGQARNGIAKLSTTGVGNADATWNPDAGFGSVFTIAALGNDVYVGGSFSSIGGQSRNRIAKLSAIGAGAADPLWDPNANAIVTAITATDEGIFIGGTFTNIGGQPRNRIAKLSATGTGAADPAWSVPLNAPIEDEAIAYGYGVLYAGGSFTNPTSRFFVTGTLSVPTLSEWGMIFFAVSIVGVGVYFSKRQINTVRV